MDKNASLNTMSFPTNDLHLLLQVMSMYPTQWDSSSMRLFLMDVAGWGNEKNIAITLSRLREGLLIPLARTILSEKDSMEQAKDRLHSTILSLQNDKDVLAKRLDEEIDESTNQNMLIETLVSDMEKMAKVSEHRKREIQQLKHTLFIKELQIQRLTEEIEHKSTWSTDNKSTWSTDDKSTWPKSTCSTEKSDNDAGCSEDSIESCLTAYMSMKDSSTDTSTPTYTTLSTDTMFSEVTDKEQRIGLLQMVLIGLWYEAVATVQRIQDRGLLCVPYALLQFWIGFTRRIVTYMKDSILSKVRHSPLGLLYA